MILLLHEEIQSGYNDAYENIEPKQPDNPFYMQGFNKGLEEKTNLNAFIADL